MVPVREPKTYSILLADDLTLVREGLAALCQGQPAYRVVGECSEGSTALRLILTQRPDIAVLDLNLSDLHTLELVRRVRDANLSTRIVVLSTRRDRKNSGRSFALRRQWVSAEIRALESAGGGVRSGA